MVQVGGNGPNRLLFDGRCGGEIRRTDREINRLDLGGHLHDVGNDKARNAICPTGADRPIDHSLCSPRDRSRRYVPITRATVRTAGWSSNV